MQSWILADVLGWKVLVILRLLYSDNMDAVIGDFAKVNFANCKNEDEIKNRSKILACIGVSIVIWGIIMPC